MKKHTAFVFAILFSVVSPTSLKAAVTEEYNSIDAINDAQDPAVIEITETETAPAVEVAAPAAPAPVTEAPVAVPAKELKSVAMSTSAYPNQGMVLETRGYQPADYNRSTGFTPMFGASIYQGLWGANIRNQYTFGLAIEMPVSRYFSFELEGGYADYKVAYQHAGGPVVAYSFQQYNAGGNAKIYLSGARFRPFIGGGLQAMFYDKMSRTTVDGNRVPYSHLMGSAQLMAGLEFAVNESISLGGRFSYLIPVINKPFTANVIEATGAQAAVGQEETGIVNNGVFRIMGTVSVRM